MTVRHLGITVNLHPFKSVELNTAGIINPSLNLARKPPASRLAIPNYPCLVPFPPDVLNSLDAETSSA
jgi:hypothetical protein